MTGKPRQAGGQTDGYRQYPSRRRVVVACGCTNPDQIAALSDTRAGFAAVGETARTAIGKETVWIQNAAEAEANAKRVHALTHRKTLSADIAVQVALLNNKGLQAAYADLGLTATELWQQSLQPNPTVSVEVLGIGAPGLGAYRAIEGRIANNILSLLTRDRRVAIADLRFRQAQLRAAEATLRVAGDTRTAWIDAVAAFEAAALIAQAQETANAASELAARLDETGALNKSGQARELGLWGTEVDYFVPDALPRLPNGLVARPQIEAEALSRRVDLQVAKLELEATAKEQDLTEATRTLTDLEIGKSKMATARPRPHRRSRLNSTSRFSTAAKPASAGPKLPICAPQMNWHKWPSMFGPRPVRPICPIREAIRSRAISAMRFCRCAARSKRKLCYPITA
jgi:outer membrane protein TolC